MDFISNGLLTSCMIIWWIFKEHYAKKFDISLRHDVYADLTPDANFLALNAMGTEMVKTWDEMYDLKELIDMLNWWVCLPPPGSLASFFFCVSSVELPLKPCKATSHL